MGAEADDSFHYGIRAFSGNQNRRCCFCISAVCGRRATTIMQCSCGACMRPDIAVL